MLAIGYFAIRICCIIEHLVFVAEGRVARFEDEILHAAIAAGLNLPLPFELEVVVLAGGDNVAATLAQAMEPATLDNPDVGGERLLFEATPAFARFAIEEELPTCGFLLGRQLIGNLLCKQSGLHKARPSQQ